MIDAVFLPLSVIDLDRRLRAVDPAVLLVPPRLLRRVIKHDRKLPGIGLQVPHRKCYVIGREALLAIVDRDDVGVGSDSDLPPTVVLLPRPDPDWLRDQPPERVLIKYWRLLFHAAIHRAVDARRLTAADILARIRQIGHVEFDEIRTVLQQERFLLPPEDDATIYEEFAGLFFDFTYFAPSLLPHYFSAIDDVTRIIGVLAVDVDGQALFTATRPAGAPDPDAMPDTLNGDEPGAVAPGRETGPRTISPAEARAYLQLAKKAATRGNDVRAALRYTQAAQAAPSNRVADARSAAEREIYRLVARLRPALNLTSTEAAAWRQALPALLPGAARGIWPAEARLLYDLQKICIDQERPVSAPHVAEWVYSRFRQPIVMSLPDQPIVLAVKHLRRAAGRLPAVRLGETDRQTLGSLLSASLHRAESRLRDRFRPRIVDALTAVGLIPASYPERIARDKLVEELLDTVAERGHLSQPDLRDALSRNQLKLPDLSGPREFFAGDPLLRANRELAVNMPGVYRRGEIYLRWLQRLSAATFGTRAGRWLTWNLFVPFGGAFLAIEGPLQVGHELLHLGRFTLRLFGLLEPVPSDHVHMDAPFPLAPWPAFLIGGVFFWLLLHVPPIRRVTVQMLGVVGHLLKKLLIDAPAALLRWPALRAFLESPAAQLLARFTLKPLLPAALTWFAIADFGFRTRIAAWDGAVAYIAAVLFLSTRYSREFEEATADWAVRRWEYLRDFLPGLFRLIADVFKQILEAIDRGLYAVDEWLRFRGGETRLIRVLKTVGGLIWGAISYFVRFLVVLFIEPQVNPLKHFPVVTISHKLLLPMNPSLAAVLEQSFGFGPGEAHIFAFIILGKIPGIFGFLVWEFKENWRLYRANRPADLKPVMIGHHGETLPRMLRPGFHSGTLPKLYAKLRRAERQAIKTGDGRAARRHIESLHEAEESIRRFAERELLAYVNGTPTWAGQSLRLAAVAAGSNRVRVELACSAAGHERLIVSFDEQSGWLLAGAVDPRWRISREQMAVLELALTGFYKVGGADLLRADIEAAIESPPATYEITDAGLVVWPDADSEIVYDLAASPAVVPRVVTGKPPELLAVLADQLLFRRRPAPWESWVRAWEQVAGKGETVTDSP